MDHLKSIIKLLDSIAHDASNVGDELAAYTRSLRENVQDKGILSHDQSG